uniref:Dephospho-CoA kinase n=1 Tax=Caldisericum exile TaxID=693075 RepID=A0A7C4U214_9BACT
MKIIGLTGNIASGKSFVSSILKELGAFIIDMDKIGRMIQEQNYRNVLEKIREVFGDGIFESDGTLNRKALGEIVFKDRDKLEKLNEIMYPLMEERLIEEIEYAKSVAEVIVVDAAILIEAGWDKLVDEVWVVYTPKNLQLKRLVEREKIDLTSALSRIDAQMPIEEKIKCGDVVINNSEDMEKLKQVVIDLWKRRVLST